MFFSSKKILSLNTCHHPQRPPRVRSCFSFPRKKEHLLEIHACTFPGYSPRHHLSYGENFTRPKKNTSCSDLGLSAKRSSSMSNRRCLALTCELPPFFEVNPVQFVVQKDASSVGLYVSGNVYGDLLAFS